MIRKAYLAIRKYVRHRIWLWRTRNEEPPF